MNLTRAIAAAASRLFAPRTRWQGAVAVGLLSAALIVPWLGRKDILSADEGQRAYPPWEMLQSGDWLVPRLNGQPYLKKPPLLYWQIAPLYRAAGVNEWTARLPSALSGVALAIVVFLWASEFASLSAAAAAGVFTACNALIIIKSRESQLDVPMTLFIAGAQWANWRALQAMEAGRRGAWRPIFAAGLCLAIAHFYKFPIPYLFVMASWLGASMLLRRWRWMASGLWWLALALSVAPVAVWGWLAVRHAGWDWNRAAAYWGKEAALRMGEVTEINYGPPWFYLVLLIVCFIPWFLLYPALFTKAFARAQSHRRLAFVYVASGAVGSLVILSLMRAKEGEYMLGAVPLLNILLALSWEWLAGQSRPGAVAAGTPAAEHKPGAPRPRWVVRCVPRWLLAGGVGLYALAAWAVTPIYEGARNRKNSFRPIATQARALVDAGRRLILFDADNPALLFYLRRRVEESWHEENVAQRMKNDPAAIVMTNEKGLAALQSLRARDRHLAFHVLARSSPQVGLVLAELRRPSPPSGP